MRKLIISLILSILLFGSAYAVENTDMTTFESMFYIKATHTIPSDSVKELKLSITNPEYLPAFKSFIESCKPFNENIEVNILDFNFSFNVKNVGWLNDKCSYTITAKINSISDDMKTALKITAPTEELTSIVPEVKCNFDKEQLALFTDVIMEKSRFMTPRSDKIAVYRPASKDISRLDEKFISMMKKGDVCKVTNFEEIMELIEKFSNKN